MRGKTHALSGAVAWLAVAPLTTHSPGLAAVSFVPAIWGAYGPDMDHPRATWAHSVPGGEWWARVAARTFGGHRMGTHSLVSIAVALTSSAFVLYLVQAYTIQGGGSFPTSWVRVPSIAFALGWTAHIVGDMLTVQGVGLLYPFSRRFFRIARLRTSASKRLNPGEAVFVFVLYFTGAMLSISLIGGYLV